MSTLAISPQRRDEILDALRRGTVPASGLDLLVERGTGRTFPGLGMDVSVNHFSVIFQGSADYTSIQFAIEKFRSDASTTLEAASSENILSGLKFSDCVPSSLLSRMLASRKDPSAAFELIRAQRVRRVHVF